jgi:hypothetical protein
MLHSSHPNPIPNTGIKAQSLTELTPVATLNFLQTIRSLRCGPAQRMRQGFVLLLWRGDWGRGREGGAFEVACCEVGDAVANGGG